MVVTAYPPRSRETDLGSPALCPTTGSLTTENQQSTTVPETSILAGTTGPADRQRRGTAPPTGVRLGP